MHAPLAPSRPILAPGDAVRVAALAGVVVLPLVLTGCGGGGGDETAAPPPPAAVTFTSVAVQADVDQSDAVVQVNAQGTDAEKWTRFALNGGTTGTNLPADPGTKRAARVYEFTVTATHASGNAAPSTCYVAINPALERMLPAANETVLARKHLFNRVGFGATEEELIRFRHMTHNTVVDRIIDEATIDETRQGPPDAASFTVLSWSTIATLSPAQQDAHNDAKGASLNRLYAWWWREMVRTRHPILERMALFWHNLLVVIASDIFEPKTIWRYLDLLRTHALGSYRDLLHGIARDPAMTLFLNSNDNVKGKPNENFARELLELFTLGEGQVYTEQDVVETAKCFTGWHVSSTHEFNFRQNQHETGSKTVLGLTINHPENSDQVRLDGEAVIDRILTQSRVAIFICERLWDEFIGGTRDTAIISAWATTFRNGDYQIRPLLKAILKHSAFTNSANRGNMLRSPVELHVAMFRTVGVEPNNLSNHHWQAAQEDQQLLSPPNVRGWIGGLTWIDAKTLLERRKHMQWLGWEFYNSGNQKIPARLDAVLETTWFATPVFDPAKVASDVASQGWDPRGARIRSLLVDPAIHCK